MAQKITRTITSTVVKCRVLDKETEEFQTLTIPLASKMPEDKMCKECSKQASEQGKVFVKVIEVENVDALYEMPLEVFLEHATLVKEA